MNMTKEDRRLLDARRDDIEAEGRAIEVLMSKGGLSYAAASAERARLFKLREHPNQK